MFLRKSHRGKPTTGGGCLRQVGPLYTPADSVHDDRMSHLPSGATLPSLGFAICVAFPLLLAPLAMELADFFLCHVFRLGGFLQDLTAFYRRRPRWKIPCWRHLAGISWFYVVDGNSGRSAKRISSERESWTIALSLRVAFRSNTSGIHMWEVLAKIVDSRLLATGSSRVENI